MKQICLVISALAVLSVGLTGCGNDPNGPASKKDAQKLTDLCQEKLGQSEGVCACVGEKALTDLTGKEAAFVIAMMNKDSDATEKLREELSFQEVVDASAFLTSTPTACASKAAGGE